MGKPYASELAQLSATHSWALNVEISPVRGAVGAAGTLPLIAIGSGGSLSAAHLLAGFHRHYTGRVASVATPLEAIADRLDPNVSVWLLSAGGSNVDIQAAFSALVEQEPKHLAVLCGRAESPLANKARLHSYVDVLEFVGPAGKDGFLATNSLLAFAVLIARAYALEFSRLSSGAEFVEADLTKTLPDSSCRTKFVPDRFDVDHWKISF